MLSPAAEDVEVLVDPFHGGEVCFLEDAADKLARVHGLKARVLFFLSCGRRHPGHVVGWHSNCAAVGCALL